MVPDRIMQQYAACQEHSDAVRAFHVNYYFIVKTCIFQIVGCQFSRIPAGSTERYTRWCNTLTESQLYTQVYRSIIIYIQLF